MISDQRKRWENVAYVRCVIISRNRGISKDKKVKSNERHTHEVTARRLIMILSFVERVESAAITLVHNYIEASSFILHEAPMRWSKK